MSEHSVIVAFVDYGPRFFTPEKHDLTALFNLEDELIAALEASGTGILDGHEIALDGSDGTLYMYGPDAQKLYDSVAHVLNRSPVTLGGEVILRFGEPNDADAREVTVKLGRS